MRSFSEAAQDGNFHPEGRGYGGSDGRSVMIDRHRGHVDTEDYLQNRATDTNNGVKWIKTQPYVEPDCIVNAGTSHGGAVVLFAAAREPGLYRAVISQAPGASRGGAVIDAMNDAISRIEAPVLLQHVEDDPLIKASVSRGLAETAGGMGGRLPTRNTRPWKGSTATLSIMALATGPYGNPTMTPMCARRLPVATLTSQ